MNARGCTHTHTHTHTYPYTQLPSLPYFNDNDKSDADFYKDRGYEVAGDNEAMMIDPVRVWGIGFRA